MDLSQPYHQMAVEVQDLHATPTSCKLFKWIRWWWRPDSHSTCSPAIPNGGGGRTVTAPAHQQYPMVVEAEQSQHLLTSNTQWWWRLNSHNTCSPAVPIEDCITAPLSLLAWHLCLPFSKRPWNRYCKELETLSTLMTFR